MTDQEKLELALWALRGGICWLGYGIARGRAEYVAVTQYGPYSGPEIIKDTEHADPWECLKLGKAALEAEESSCCCDSPDAPNVTHRTNGPCIAWPLPKPSATAPTHVHAWVSNRRPSKHYSELVMVTHECECGAELCIREVDE